MSEEACDQDYCNSFSLSRLSSYVTITGSTISLPFSVLTLFVIYRSRIQLSSVYHRIICATSVADIIKAFTRLLTNAPFPKDQIYPFGLSIMGGTTETCEAQAFAQFVTMMASSLYFVGLCVLYVCLIRFRTSDEVVRKYIEPCIHAVAFLPPISMATVFLVLDLLNPSPYEPWCTVAAYPWNCADSDDVECIRGGFSNYENIAELVLISIIGFAGLVVFLCMWLIICAFWDRASSVAHSRQQQQQHQQTNSDENVARFSSAFWDRASSVAHSRQQQQQRQQTNSDENVARFSKAIERTLVKQAFMYIIVFVIIWGIRLVCLLSDSDIVQCLGLLSMLSQPMLNTIIFLYHKVDMIQRVDADISTYRVLQMLIISPRDDIIEIRLSNLSQISSQGNSSVHSVREEDVDEASKDMHLSGNSSVRLEVVDEASKDMHLSFDLHEEREQLFFLDCAIDAEDLSSPSSFNDALTVKQSGRW